MKKFQRIHDSPIPVIGLTGSIGSGKSTVLEIFKKLGAHTISADTLIKEIYKRSDVIRQVINLFPDACNEREIDFKKIREIVFNDQDALNKLETILYPHLKESFNSTLDAKAPFAIYEVPLLFEKKMENGFDKIICIDCNMADLYKRLEVRSHLSKEMVDKILENQIPTEKKLKKSDFIITNDNEIRQLEERCREILQKINEH